MNIRAKVNELVQLQDCITHLVEDSPAGGSDEHLIELTTQISNRTLLSNEIVEYVMRLEIKFEAAKILISNAEAHFQESE